jgi:hypothetical protein
MTKSERMTNFRMMNKAPETTFRHLSFVFILGCLCVQSMAAGFNWEQGPGYRSAPLSVPASGKPGFTLLSPSATGITFTNMLTDAKAAENQSGLSAQGSLAAISTAMGGATFTFVVSRTATDSIETWENCKFEHIGMVEWGDRRRPRWRWTNGYHCFELGFKYKVPSQRGASTEDLLRRVSRAWHPGHTGGLF